MEDVVVVLNGLGLAALVAFVLLRLRRTKGRLKKTILQRISDE